MLHNNNDIQFFGTKYVYKYEVVWAESGTHGTTYHTKGMQTTKAMLII